MARQVSHTGVRERLGHLKNPQRLDLPDLQQSVIRDAIAQAFGVPPQEQVMQRGLGVLRQAGIGKPPAANVEFLRRPASRGSAARPASVS